jgi:hypothetical protein
VLGPQKNKVSKSYCKLLLMLIRFIFIFWIVCCKHIPHLIMILLIAGEREEEAFEHGAGESPTCWKTDYSSGHHDQAWADPRLKPWTASWARG